MSPDLAKITSIIQFALLVAGEEDDYFDRNLGPIHLLKYVFLADLYFSKRENGKSFTNIDWTFYNFGPWSEVVHSQIKPALDKIGAKCDTIESSYGDNDFYRWTLQNSYLLTKVEKSLPFSITTKLRQDIHRYLKDTPSLLDYVYKTEPMLKASPNETLNFNEQSSFNEESTTDTLRMDQLSIKKKKSFKSKMTALSEKLHNNKSTRPVLKEPVQNPRYDDTFEEGIDWLDSLAGEKIRTMNVVAKFNNEVWKSKARKGDELS